jgi:hypothetical protein
MTSVNLDEETSKIAKMLPNRSEFIRECLRRWYAAQIDGHIEPERHKRIGSCWPHAKAGVCQICWPNGVLSPDDWKYYLETLKHHGKSAGLEEWKNERLIPVTWEIPTKIPKKTRLQTGVKASKWAKIANRIKGDHISAIFKGLFQK